MGIMVVYNNGISVGFYLVTTKCWDIDTDFSFGTGGTILATEHSDLEHMLLSHADQDPGPSSS